MTNFNKAHLAKALSANIAGISKDVADDIITGLFQIIKEEAAAGKTVTIHGFGRFAIKERAARTGRNPATGEPLDIPASSVLGFRPTKPAA